MGFECPGKRGCHGRHRSGVEDAEKWEIQMGRNFPFKSLWVSGEIKSTTDPPSPISHLNLSGFLEKSSLPVIRRVGRLDCIAPGSFSGKKERWVDNLEGVCGF